MIRRICLWWHRFMMIGAVVIIGNMVLCPIVYQAPTNVLGVLLGPFGLLLWPLSYLGAGKVIRRFGLWDLDWLFHKTKAWLALFRWATLVCVYIYIALWFLTRVYDALVQLSKNNL